MGWRERVTEFPENGMAVAQCCFGGEFCYAARNMNPKHRIVLLANILLFIVSVSFAQQKGTILLGLEADERADVKDVNLSNLRVTVDKKPVRVLSVSQMPVPGHLVIALDVSGSQRSPQAWYTELVAAREMVRLLDPHWKITLMPFAEGADSDLPELSRDEIVSKLNLMIKDPMKYAHGGSQVRDAIVIAIKSYKMGPGDAVLLVSNGEDNDSNFSQSKFEAYLRKSPVRVFACVVTQPPFSDSSIRPLRKALLGSGGLVSYLRTPEFESVGAGDLQAKNENGKPPQILQTVADIATLITQPSRIEVELPGGIRGELKVEVLNSKGKPAKHLIVLAPKWLADDGETKQ